MAKYAKYIKIEDKTDGLINELSNKRKSEGSLIKTKQAIVAEAIQALHKKEFK